MKMNNLSLWLVAGLVVCATMGCDKQQQAATAITPPQDSVSAVEINGAETEYKEPPRPEPKADAEIKALQKGWDAAEAAEKKFLGNPQLDKWIAGMKETVDEDGMPVYGKLDDAKFNALTPIDVLHYTTYHPESWDQICAEWLFEAGMVKAISPELPVSGDYASDRQAAAMRADLDSIKAIVVRCVTTTKTVSLSMLHTIVAYDINGAILPLLDIYKQQTTKDDLILSACIELMEHAKYAEWLNSEPRKHVIDVWQEWMPLNEANADKIMLYAKKFAAS